MVRLLVLFFLCLPTIAPAQSVDVFTSDCSSESDWPERKNVTPHALSLTFGAAYGGQTPCLLVHGSSTSRLDTAWLVCSSVRPFPPGSRSYRLRFEAMADCEMAPGGIEGEEWNSGVSWLGMDGRTVRFDPIVFVLGDSDGFQPILHGGDIPTNAVAFRVQFGFDRPNIYAGHNLALAHVRMAVTPDVVPPPRKRPRPDSRPPAVRILNRSPLPDATERLEVSVFDESGVDGKSVVVFVDGKDVTALCSRAGDRWICKPPASQWATGIHTVRVDAVDVRGHRSKSTRFFAVGDSPRTPDTKLRSDGTVLVDGEAFFPIGPYSIQECDFNSNSFDRAFAQLCDAGMNFAQSYGRPAERMLDAARAHGCRMLVRACENDGEFLSVRRHHPAILAWYLADDTYQHYTTEELAHDDSFVKALDDRHLTAQADEVGSFMGVSNYTDYVPYTDVFLPEIYPLRKDRHDTAAECVAEVVFDMKRARADAISESPDRPKSIWALLQTYYGTEQCWCRMPTSRELMAMTFAAVCNGANGILFYTYNCPSSNNFGMVSSPEIWSATTNVTMRLSSIYGLMCAPDRQAPEPRIVDGPAHDYFGSASISCSVRHWQGSEWVIAVNSTTNAIRAVFHVTAPSAVAGVWGENRSCPVVNGRFEDTFAGYDVHIYQVPLPGVPPVCEDGFVPLLNGKDLTGWEGAVDTYRVTQEGSLTCVQTGGVSRGGVANLWTDRDYSDFQIRFDVKLPANANNGLGIRTRPNGVCSKDGIEIQLLDDWGDRYNGKNRLGAAQYTGSIYGLVAPKRRPDGKSYMRPTGEWNSIEVTAVGSRIVVVLNGEKVVDADVSKLSTCSAGVRNEKGRIHWCGHGENVVWRNIRVKEL